MSGQNKKLCFAASTGGHFEQILMLRPLMERYDSFLMTEKTTYEVDVKGQRIYYLSQLNRKERAVFFRMIKNAAVSLYIMIKERPDVVIATGALSTIPICLLAKCFGKKLVFIESFAKVTSPTRTGKFLYRFADRFYVQWESMLAFYPGAICLGGIY